MIWIQTALRQEFTAVARVLEHVTVTEGQGTRRGTRLRSAAGTIENRPCCVIETGMGPRAAEAALLELLQYQATPNLILSIGWAGALIPDLSIGQRCVITEVRRPACESPKLRPDLDRLASAYVRTLDAVRLVTVPRPALTPAAKLKLFLNTKAALCDMETYSTARVATAHGCPWLGARIVSDTARETLERRVLVLPRWIDRGKWRQLLAQLATHPQDLPRLLRLGLRVRRLQHQLAQFTVEFICNVEL